LAAVPVQSLAATAPGVVVAPAAVEGASVGVPVGLTLGPGVTVAEPDAVPVAAAPAVRVAPVEPDGETVSAALPQATVTKASAARNERSRPGNEGDRWQRDRSGPGSLDRGRVTRGG